MVKVGAITRIADISLVSKDFVLTCEAEKIEITQKTACWKKTYQVGLPKQNVMIRAFKMPVIHSFYETEFFRKIA